MSETEQEFSGLLRHGSYRLSAVTLFVFFNGIIVALIAFVLLKSETQGLQKKMAYRATQNIHQKFFKDLQAFEKKVKSVSFLYGTLAADPARIEAQAKSVQKILDEETQIQGIIWTTGQDLWLYEDLVSKKSIFAHDPSRGFPSYALLQEVALAQDYDVPYVVGQGLLLKGKKEEGKPASAPFLILLKSRMESGSTGLTLVFSRFENFFESALMAQDIGLASIQVHQQATGKALFEKRYTHSTAPAEKTIGVDYALSFGSEKWDLTLHVFPSGVARLLSYVPLLGAAFLILLTVLMSFVFQRKYQQDLKMREISKTLEGAHSELQQKTTERDRLFYALRQSERENRALINSVSDIIFETDQHGKILFLNETWKRVTDRETSYAISRSLFDMIDPIDRVKHRDMFDELVRGERGSYRVETRLDLGQGKWRSVEIAFSMLRLADQQDLRVVGTITDIEKRRRAEIALREAEQRFRAIFENSVSGIYQSSLEGKFISANPATAEILGYSSPEDLVFSVTDIAEQIYVRPEERKNFAERLLVEGTISGLETELYRKDGKKIWVMENARIVRNEKGAVDYYEGSIWDVTEQHLAEETMRQARIHAEISSRSRMEFLANMSHELRTPLNAVIGFSEIIRDEVMGPMNVPVYKDYAKDIFESGSQLLRVINEILEVSKLEMGTRELNENHFRLSTAIQACTTILSGKVEQGEIDLKLSVPDDLPEIYAERMAIKQIILNLAGNAIKFTPKGGKVEVSAYLDASSGEMVIDVKDTGAGMTEEEIKKAMEPFSKIQTSFDTMKEGAGLGLTIVNALVELHGGTFRLISQKGVGTLARVTLPKSRVMVNKPMEKPASV